MEQLAQALEGITDAVVVMDEEGTILLVNSAVQRELGYLPSELEGRDVTVLMPEPHRTRHAGYVSRFQSTGERRILGTGRRVQALRKDGSLLDINLGVSETKVEGRRVFVGSLRDISHQVASESELSRQRDELLIQARINEILQSATTREELIERSLRALVDFAALEVESKAGFFEQTMGPDGTGEALRLVQTVGTFSEEFLRREAWVPLGECLCGRAAV